MDVQNRYYIADAAEAKKIDRISIQEIGIPSMVLMERAAMSVASCIMETTDPKHSRILAVCGTGNNGGDGVAAVRILQESGYAVSVLVLGQEEKCSLEMQKQIAIVRKLGIPVKFWMQKESAHNISEFVTEEKLDQYNVIIDAIFGIGLSRGVTGMYQQWITWINQTEARVVSVDIPSGIYADTGGFEGAAVKADQTVTFGVNKRGLLLYPGTQYAGEIVVVDIGFPKQALDQVSPKAFTYHPGQISTLLPTRYPRSHKGSYGKVLVIAGSPQMSGACYFSSTAAYRVGAGLVQILTAEENAQVLRTKLPEAIVTAWSEKEIDAELEKMHSMMDQASAIVIGPGISRSDAARKLLKAVLDYGSSAENAIPIVIDADGLNLLAGMEEYFMPCESGGRKIKLGRHFVLTPHLKEMSRLIGQDVPEIANRMTDMVEKRGSGCTIVLKDARTLVSDGTELYINTPGNSALAKGGSGDVLSGMIGGLLAQGMDPMKAASLAVCLHGMTADRYIENNGIRSMLASDILAEIPKLMR